MKTTKKTDSCTVEDMLADDLLNDPDFEVADAELLAWRDAEVSTLRLQAAKRRAGRKPNRRASAERFAFPSVSTPPSIAASRRSSVLAKPAKSCAN